LLAAATEALTFVSKVAKVCSIIDYYSGVGVSSDGCARFNTGIVT